MDKGIELRTREGKKEVSFKVSAMPLEHFLRFKRLADEEWGSSYWHTIKFLMDWFEMTKNAIVVGLDESKVEENKKEIKFLGD